MAYDDVRTGARAQARLGRRTGRQTGRTMVQIEPKSCIARFWLVLFICGDTSIRLQHSVVG